MTTIHITVTDTPKGVDIQSDYKPKAGAKCTAAEAAALDMINRTRAHWAVTAKTQLAKPIAVEVDIDAVHRTRDNVVREVRS